MRFLRAIDSRAAGRHVAGRGEHHSAPLFGHRFDLEALLAHELLGRRGDADASEHSLVADAAPRVGVLQVDQLTEGVAAIAHDARGYALGDRRQLAADDQHPVVIAGNERLDDHVTARLSS